MRVTDLESIRIKLASPEDILRWSHGEVIRPETINYRTQRAEKDGLFCEKIFGPTKDFQCYCGKYKGIRYKGVVCDRCGVEVTKSSVRRERMGHVKLACPVSHIWFLKGVPSRIGMVLDIPMQKIEKVIYFSAYIITSVDEEAKKRVREEIDKEYEIKKKMQGASKGSRTGKKELQELKKARDLAKEDLARIKPMKILSEIEYYNYSMKYGEVFEAGTGSETLRKIFEKVDLEKEIKKLKKQAEKETALTRRKLLRRLKMLEGMVAAKIRPEWMFLTVLPVLPPDLRPMVQLDGGRYASSDLNDLYRRVINRNNRLKYLLEIDAPEVIVRNEKRMLQEAVDALIDNSMRKGILTTATTGGRRLLKSLADIIKGKKGRFRQNLLGKRVENSGRSVIVVGPKLKLHQCGLPKKMALELFKPFVIREILDQELAYNVRGAGRLIEQQTDDVWAILEDVVREKVVLLNRAPTLHRLGIQAFQPILVEGEAIHLHPMVCKAFNADFDGDQMAAHLPLTEEAQKEAVEIMLSSKNLLKPATGEPIVVPSQDIVLGCYYMTKIVPGCKGEGKMFSSFEEAVMAYELGAVDLKAAIKLKNNCWKKVSKKTFSAEKENKFIETSVGRIIFNKHLPKELMFINAVMDSSALKLLVADSLEKLGQEETVLLVDRIKELGFYFATESGLSWGMGDLKIPDTKKQLFEEADKRVDEIRSQYEEGLLTDNERRIKTIEVWTEVRNKIAQIIPKTINDESSVAYMINSGARSNWAVVAQMSGMKGLVVNPSGETIELPIKSSFKEGFNVLEYFISTHGTRKGMADTALRTSTAGYLTRKLVDVAQVVIIHEEDCHSTEGTEIVADEQLDIGRTLAMRVRGRTALKDVKNPKTGKIIVKAGEQISKEKSKEIEKADVSKVSIRSIVNCKAKRGLCRQCYGYDLGKNKLVEISQAVGIVTAQAIGEPGTQLTMRTFHSGGVAGKDITQGLPRVEEIFEARPPKGKAVISEVDGKVEDIVEGVDTKTIKIKFKPGAEEALSKEKVDDVKSYVVDKDTAILVNKGDLVTAGQQLVEGHIDLHELFNLKDVEEVKKYIIKEVQQVYTSQGEGIDDKHIEIIIRQMLSRVRIKDPGDTNLLIGDVVEKAQFLEANEEIEKENKRNKGVTDKMKRPAIAKQLLLGITKASLTTESFLSAASFQETARVLINAAVTGKEDKLRGLKENVIIGRLIPCGTGYKRRKKTIS